MVWILSIYNEKCILMRKRIFLISICFLFVLPAAEAQNKINWITFEEAYAKVKTHPKKVMIDVYTDWCGWCKVMDQKTFTDPDVIKYVNENYYAVKFDAEGKNEVKIEKDVFKPNASGRSHALAISLLQGKMSYPSIVYLNESFNMIQPIPGYQDAKVFHQVITFLGGDYFKKESFEDYKKGTYVKTFVGK